MPPQRRRVVEEAQSAVVAVVRRLDEAGAIVLSRGSDEDELVG
jgi:flagellar motor switch protein FliG